MAGKKLHLAALGNNTGEVIDLADNKRQHMIAGLRKPTGTLLLTEPHRFYFANGDDGSFRSFDATTSAPASQLTGLDDADNVRFDTTAKLIYIGYGEGVLAATDPATSKLHHSIPLTAHPELFRLDMLIAMRDAGEIPGTILTARLVEAVVSVSSLLPRNLP